jgi:hypothetical protein
MRKTIYSLLICLLIVQIQATAQFSERYYEEGPLSWEEFKKVDTTQLKGASFFTYYIDFYFAKEKRNDTTFYFFKGENFTDKNTMAVVEQFVDTPFLQYHQLLFDISELARRRMQQAFIGTNTYVINANTLLDQAYDEAEENINKMNEDTRFGIDQTRLDHWQDSIQNLISLKGSQYFPKYALSKSSFGAHVGLGGSLMNQEMREYINPPAFFGLGINYQYQKLFTGLGITFGSTSSNQQVIGQGNNLWLKDSDVRHYQVMANFGYLLKARRVQCIPYAGLGLSGYQFYRFNEFAETVSEGNSRFAPQLGFYLDFVLSNRASINREYQAYFNGSPENSVESHSIRLNFSFTPITYKGIAPARADIMQISANYSFHSTGMKVYHTQ